MLWFSRDGLHIGTFRVEPSALPDVAKSRDGLGDRLETLLAIAFAKRPQPAQLATILAAAEISRRGDQALANIRLAMSRLARIPDPDGLAERLMRAEQTQPREVHKYDPDQPRVPAGNGRESGRFGSGGGSTAAKPPTSHGAVSVQIRVASAFVALRAVSGPSFLAPGVAAEALAALGTFAVAIGGAAAVFGTIFVPSPNSTSIEGPLPGGQGLSYHYDHDEGMLRLRDPDGTIVAAGSRDQSGIFHDADTGIAIGRDIGGTLVFEQASMVAATGRADVISRTDTDAATANDNQPRLCPDPIAERPNGASPRARAYQEQISALVNPQSPLPYGLAMAFFNPVTGKWVKPDDCDEKDGALIEAKGPGFARNLKYDFLQRSYENGFIKQARAQVQASGAREVRWYFAEQATAEIAARAFARQSDLAGRIKVRFIEAIVK